MEANLSIVVVDLGKRGNSDEPTGLVAGNDTGLRAAGENVRLNSGLDSDAVRAVDGLSSHVMLLLVGGIEQFYWQSRPLSSDSQWVLLFCCR
jgi:hypothetical protein